MATRRIIESTRHSFHTPELQGVYGTLLFEVEGGGAWSVQIDDGKVVIADGRPSGRVDCTLTANDEDMALVLSGRQNLLTAAMQGRITFQGDPMLAQTFHSYLRGHADEMQRSPR